MVENFLKSINAQIWFLFHKYDTGVIPHHLLVKHYLN